MRMLSFNCNNSSRGIFFETKDLNHPNLNQAKEFTEYGRLNQMIDSTQNMILFEHLHSFSIEQNLRSDFIEWIV